MFGTSGIRGEVGTEITADLAHRVGRALAAEGHETVVVGRDARESGSLIADAVCTGLRSGGTDTIRVGVASTPTIARGISHFDADAGVAVTASHNPPEDNGLKLWTPSGRAFDASQCSAVTARVHAQSYSHRNWEDLGSKTYRDAAVEHHAAALVETTELDDPLSVVVDAANGPGVVTADVLEELGCDVTTLNGQLDGRFPGRPSEPTRENCEALQHLVAASDADLGIAHDGDADRMMAVTDRGEFVTGDHLLALFGRTYAGRGEEVAAPLNTSLAVDDALAEVGASVTRTRVGDVSVAQAATKPNVVFGGEPSGAWMWPDETLCPDGPLAACKLVELVSRDGPLSDQLETIETHPMARETLSVADKQAVMNRVRGRVQREHSAVETKDGVRVETDDGWFLVRASGTQPVVRVTAEAREESALEGLLEEAVGHVRVGRPA
jgi:phosphoglucosamine mutase